MTTGNEKGNERTRIVDADEAGGPLDVDSDGKSTQVRRGPVVATVTIVEGPGVGNSFAVYGGDNAIGRGPQNRIELNFGDETIHRERHAWINADEKSIIIEHGGKANPVHVNGQRIEGVRTIVFGDRIKIGSTTLRLDPK
jgi:hypothetical protein